MTSPEIRKLPGDRWCVDCGSIWYVVEPDGSVTTKRATQKRGAEFATIERRPATAAEHTLAHKALGARK